VKSITGTPGGACPGKKCAGIARKGENGKRVARRTGPGTVVILRVQEKGGGKRSSSRPGKIGKESGGRGVEERSRHGKTKRKVTAMPRDFSSGRGEARPTGASPESGKKGEEK